MKDLIKELEKYLKLLNVKQLYTDPGHKDAKNWLAEVNALLKTSRRYSYKKFTSLSQHLYPSIPIETRKHAAEQIDVYIRQIIAQYKREYLIQERSQVKNKDDKIDEIRVFISYSSLNKKGAGEIKRWLSKFGFNVFLAHDDIRPSLEWQKVIIDNLKACHVFIPIITPEFNESKWTDQESGMAFITSKLIIPVSVDNGPNPHGFLSVYQALKFKSKELEKECIKIVKAIKNEQRCAPIVLDLLIKSLKKARSYASSEWRTSLISEFDSFTKKQFDLILETAISNNQIHFADRSRKDLQNLIKQHPKLVNSALLKQLNNTDENFKFG
ncbi:MAG: toll/interleukin-1 receptor domain-containing protein [Candidatus Pacebacteria bacterium]|nr:toll/interleukin-1 receptor domain-containing protein [Candidatus Paceibacterota bacterium]